MSQPARKLDPRSRPQPERKPSRVPASAGPLRTQVRRRSASQRRRIHIGFAIFAAAVLTLMVAGVVALNALLDQRALQITASQQEVGSLQVRDRVLTEQAAALDSPGRVGLWARGHGLVMPPQGAVVILNVPGQGSPASGGGA